MQIIEAFGLVGLALLASGVICLLLLAHFNDTLSD